MSFFELSVSDVFLSSGENKKSNNISEREIVACIFLVKEREQGGDT